MLENNKFDTDGRQIVYHRPKCSEVIQAHSSTSLDILVRIHEFDHRRIGGMPEKNFSALALYKQENSGFTFEDREFLRECGIAL